MVEWTAPAKKSGIMLAIGGIGLSQACGVPVRMSHPVATSMAALHAPVAACSVKY